MSSPYMPFYVGDFVRDTMDMTPEEVGAYVLLICHYWSNCGLPDDEERLIRIARVSKQRWKCIRNAIAMHFSDKWRHKRIDAELLKTQKKSMERALASRKRWNKQGKSPHAIEYPNAKQKLTNQNHRSKPSRVVLCTEGEGSAMRLSTLALNAIAKRED